MARFFRQPYRRTAVRRRAPPRRSYAATGTRFVARRFTGKVTGREVPYYLGRGIEAHVADTVILHDTTPNETGHSVFKATSVNLLERGTGISMRESQRASMKYILIRLRVQLEGLNVPVGLGLTLKPITCRVLVVYATAQLQVDLQVTDVLTTPTGSQTDIATAGSQRIDSRENYQILYDNKFVLRNQNKDYQQQQVERLPVTGDYTFRDLDLKLPIRRPVSFSASAVDNIHVSNLTHGSLWILTVFDDLIDSTAQRQIGCTAKGSVRLVFSP